MDKEKRREEKRNMAEAATVKEESGVMTIQIQIQEAVSGFQRPSFVTERCSWTMQLLYKGVNYFPFLCNPLNLNQLMISLNPI